jgi:hypothetical protein
VAILAGLESATPIEGIEKPLFETCGIWCGWWASRLTDKGLLK